MKYKILSIIIILVVYSCSLFPTEEKEYLKDKYKVSPTSVTDSTYLLTKDSKPEIKLNSVKDLKNYKFEIYKDNKYSQLIESSKIENDKLSYVLKNPLESFGMYFWRIKCVFKNGEESPWYNYKLYYSDGEYLDDFDYGNLDYSPNNWNIEKGEVSLEKNDVYEGEGSLRLGYTGSSSNSLVSIKVTVNKESALSFFYKSKRDADFDYSLGSSYINIPFSNDWTYYAINLTPGTQTISFRYDCGFYDDNDSAIFIDLIDLIEFDAIDISSLDYLNSEDITITSVDYPENKPALITDNINKEIRIGKYGQNEDSSLTITINSTNFKKLIFEYIVDDGNIKFNDNNLNNSSNTVHTYQTIIKPGSNILKWEHDKYYDNDDAFLYVKSLNVSDIDLPDSDFLKYLENDEVTINSIDFRIDDYPVLTGENLDEIKLANNLQRYNVFYEVEVDIVGYKILSFDYNYSSSTLYFNDSSLSSTSGLYKTYSEVLYTGTHTLKWSYNSSSYIGDVYALIKNIKINDVTTMENTSFDYLNSKDVAVSNFTFENSLKPIKIEDTNEWTFDIGRNGNTSFEFDITLNSDSYIYFDYNFPTSDLIEFYINDEKKNLSNSGWKNFSKSLPQGTYRLKWIMKCSSSYNSKLSDISISSINTFKEDSFEGPEIDNSWMFSNNFLPEISSDRTVDGQKSLKLNNNYRSSDLYATKFIKIDNVSELSFSYYIDGGGSFSLYLDGSRKFYDGNLSTQWKTFKKILAPGVYKLEFNYNKYYDSVADKMYIDNVKVDNVVVMDNSSFDYLNSSNISISNLTYSNNNRALKGESSNEWVFDFQETADVEFEFDINLTKDSYIVFDHNFSSTDFVEFYIDNVKKSLSRNDWKSYTEKLETGTYRLKWIMKCSSSSNSKISNIMIHPVVQLNNESFENDEIDNSWIFSQNFTPLISSDKSLDGDKSLLLSSENNTIELSATRYIKIDETSKLSFSYFVESGETFIFSLDDSSEINISSRSSEWNTYKKVLAPGVYKLNFIHKKYNGNNSDRVYLDDFKVGAVNSLEESFFEGFNNDNIIIKNISFSNKQCPVIVEENMELSYDYGEYKQTTIDFDITFNKDSFISFDYIKTNFSSLKFYVDDINQSLSSDKWLNKELKFEPGIYNIKWEMSCSSSYYSKLANIKITEIDSLDKLSFETDDNKWIYNSYNESFIDSSKYTDGSKSAVLSSEESSKVIKLIRYFKVEKDYKLIFDYFVDSGEIFRAYLNDSNIAYSDRTSDWESFEEIIKPGVYKIEFWHQKTSGNIDDKVFIDNLRAEEVYFINEDSFNYLNNENVTINEVRFSGDSKPIYVQELSQWEFDTGVGIDSIVEVDVTLNKTGFIFFNYSVSHGALDFYIDGEEQSISNKSDSYYYKKLTAGQYTFKWTSKTDRVVVSNISIPKIDVVDNFAFDGFEGVELNNNWITNRVKPAKITSERSQYGSQSILLGSEDDSDDISLERYILVENPSNFSFGYYLEGSGNIWFSTSYIFEYLQKDTGAWRQFEGVLAPGIHKLDFRFGKRYGSINDKVFIDNIKIEDSQYSFFEDFNSGILDPSYEGDWIIVENNDDSSKKSLKSNKINNNEKTSFSFEVNISKESLLSFIFKTDTEENYDKLELFINETEKSIVAPDGKWSWRTKSFILSPGLNSIKFVYSKNESGSSGEDCIWIDNIIIQ